jgi:hypothetical protein
MTWTGGRNVPRAATKLIDRVLDDVGYDDDIEVEFVDKIAPYPHRLTSGSTIDVTAIGDTHYGCDRCSVKIRVMTGMSPNTTEQTVLHELAHVLYRSWQSHNREFFEVAFSLYGTFGHPEWLQDHVEHDASNFADAMYVARQYGIGDMVPSNIVEYHANQKKIDRLRGKCWSAIYTMTPARRLRFLNKYRDPATDRFTTADMNVHGGADAIHAVIQSYAFDDVCICLLAQLLNVDPKYIPVIEESVTDD